MTATQTADTCVWIDGVGGYLLSDRGECRIGSAAYASSGSGPAVDAAIFADIPRVAFTLAARGETTVLQPEAPGVSLNGRSVAGPAVLRSGDRIGVGTSVQLKFRKPNPLSETAVLTLLSRHRWLHSIDGVVLMGHCCLIGNTTDAHILNAHTDREWMLTRSAGGWEVSPLAPRSLAGSSWRSQRHTLQPRSRFAGEGIQITLTEQTRA